MAESLAGRFLIAGKHLRDPNFYKSVVLMVEHGSQGAMGLVVNRPSPVTVGQALAEHFEIAESEDLVFYGGPVEPGALFVVHNGAELDSQENYVVPGVFVGSSADVFEQVVRGAAAGHAALKYRIFAGCAGWGPGQLEGELGRGDWYLLPADAETTFHVDPYNVWETSLHRVGESIRPLPPDSPTNPEWN